jgi:acyl-CoA dehydrogenase
MIKTASADAACQVIDWAIQAHGGGGVSEDFPLAAAWAAARTLRLADGPDEVHRNQIAKLELARYKAR